MHYTMLLWISEKKYPILECTGSLNSKRDNLSSIYGIFEIKMCNRKCICMFIGNGHLSIDPWIWLELTTLSSTASVLKDGRIWFEVVDFWWSIPHWETRIGHFGARVDKNIKLNKFFDELRLLRSLSKLRLLRLLRFLMPKKPLSM